jgi:hypothetical protein
MRMSDLCESPQRVPPTTFNFADLVVMKSVSEVIEDTAEYQMVTLTAD